MIKKEYIRSIEDTFKLIIDQEMDGRVGRNRSSFLYRGLPNESYHLQTSLQRNCKNKQKELELCILRNFSKYATSVDPQIDTSIWRQMFIGQHHGLPTRLLDWTYSPLIGLHFALSEDDCSGMDQHNCVVWKIDIEELNSLLPLKYKETLEKEKAYLFTVDMITSLVETIECYDDDMNNKGMVLIEPSSIDQRIINQYSYFAIIPSEITNIEEFLDKYTSNTVKYIIDKNMRWRIRDMLDQLNINERIMFPGLDGLSSWLKRHYYVK